MKRVMYLFVIGFFLLPAFAVADEGVTQAVTEAVVQSSEDLSPASDDELVIESEDEFNSKTGGTVVAKPVKKPTVKAGETDVSIINDQGPPEASKKDIDRAKSNQNCNQVGDGARLDRDCKGKTKTVIARKLVDHEIRIFSAGGVALWRKFSRYPVAGMSYLGSYNFSPKFSFVFGSDLLFSPVQGDGDQYYTDLNRTPKGIAGLMVGFGYTSGKLSSYLIAGGAISNNSKFDSIPIKGRILLTSGKVLFDFGINYKIFNQDFEILGHSAEAVYRWKYIGLGLRSEYFWGKPDWYVWQWSLDGEAVAEYYFSNHFANNDVSSNWGSIRLQGGRSKIDLWIGRAEVRFKF